jgi:hypothetical protein
VWATTFAGIDATVRASGKGTVALAQPFIPVVPGTDTYLDEIFDARP